MSENSNLEYSVVIPVHNEEENVIPLHQELLEVLQHLGKAFEIIFIDDGSTDGTFGRLQSLHPVKIIRFRKNFGQTAAMDAGFRAARGNVIITLDGDRQNDPHDIPALLSKLDEGYEVVSGWRWQRKDTHMKHFVSRGANVLRGLLIKDQIHDSGCSLKVYRKECFENLNLFGEMHRFIPAILGWQGFKVGELKVSHRPRIAGKTKYGWKRIVKGFVDMISVWFWRKYSNRPLHLFGSAGLLFISIGTLLGFGLLVGRAFFGLSLANRIWPLLAVFVLLAGIQLFVSGLMADILIKIHFREKPSYSVKEVFENS
ncbi:MAG: glycosyltransferase family 2 protein [Patescibacteria group bacterium]